MNKKEGIERINAIETDALESATLTDKEKEIALKILKNLEGNLVIRANSILKFCLKAIQHTKI